MQISTIFIVLSLLSPVTEAQPRQPVYVAHDCGNDTFPLNSAYRVNRDSLLSSLSSNGSRGDGFYNTTSGRSPNRLYGLFLCRGDLSPSACQDCVTLITNDIPQRCPTQTTAVIWYEECTLRYSNQYIFSVVAEEPAVSLYSRNAIDDQEVSAAALIIMTDTAAQMENEPAGAKKFATRESRLSSSQTVYTSVQCTPDLSGMDCSRCLHVAIANLSDCCGSRQGAVVLMPSCVVRYDDFPFYNVTGPAPGGNRNESNRTPVLVATLSATFGLLFVSISGFCIWRRRKSRDNTENSQGGQLLDLVDGRIPDEHSPKTFSGENGESQKFPSIQLEILHAATDHFARTNKLGEGGFGPVYKAWKQWSSGEGMQLIDQLLVPSCVVSEVLKCIHIGLLCVQEDPADRPTMSSVIFMLASDDSITLASPTKPAFSVGRVVSEPSEPNSNGVRSVNEVTISSFLPR
ncbi:hypothetical protein V6N11_032744 [Hibiscus sabdariffa]|uniref:Gnk2-homologous domain-containing protein n=1 Tax=Hibiscus sabdariffa TaxID=183260 RepID=A0ABR2T1J6_9ROSI